MDSAKNCSKIQADIEGYKLIPAEAQSELHSLAFSQLQSTVPAVAPPSPFPADPSCPTNVKNALSLSAQERASLSQAHAHEALEIMLARNAQLQQELAHAQTAGQLAVDAALQKQVSRAADAQRDEMQRQALLRE